MLRQATLASAVILFTACGGGGGNDPAPPPPPPPPAPTISTLTPNSAIVAGSNFVLTVTGTGFVATSVIQWNGSARPTTFVDSTNLQAPIPATDIAAAGQPAITVVNPAANGGASSAATFTVNNPAPTISVLTPSFVSPGGAAFSLTVDGTGFVSDSLVRWNGANRTTTFVSATRLTAAITAADIANQGNAQVTVLNATPGGGTSAALAVSIGNPLPQISQINPPVVRPGSPAFTLGIDGAAFILGSNVSWNGVSLPTTVVSATRLQVAIAATDVANAGSAQVVAFNPAPGGGASNAATLSIAPYGVIDRLSVATDGTEANGDSDYPSMSADGRFVAFASAATNLVPGDTNGAQDIFLRDTCFGVASGCTASTVRVSVDSAGTQSNGANSAASISADGRYVAFESLATNLVPGDTNGVVDVFVRDTCAAAPGACTPSTTRVSVATDGSQGNLGGSKPSINADGRYIAFISGSIFVLGDINAVPDAFIRDICAGAAACTPSTTRVSLVNDSDADYQGVRGVSIGSDARYVGFLSHLRCIGCNVLQSRVFVFDTCRGAGVGCSSVAVLAAEERNSSGDVAINDRALSTNGRFVVYDRNVNNDRYGEITDTCIGAPQGCAMSTRQLTPSDQSMQFTPTLTADGRFASFVAPSPGSSRPDIFMHDTCAGSAAGCVFRSLVVSESDDGIASNAANYNSTLAGDGSRAAFASDADNLIAGDANGRRDIFLARTGLAP